MKSRRYTAYRSCSFSGIAILARHGLLEFCRRVRVERDGRAVWRMVNAPDLTPEEREIWSKPRAAAVYARNLDRLRS